MKNQLLEKPTETVKDSDSVFYFRTNSNLQKPAATYINPFSKKSIHIQAVNALGWLLGFRMGVVR